MISHNQNITKYYVIIINMYIILILLCVGCVNTAKRDISTVSALIKRYYKDATLMSYNDFSQKDCGVMNKEPGLVVSDFNTDGFDDYAVLLKTKEEKAGSWKNIKYSYYQLYFTVFLSTKKKTLKYQNILLEEIEEDIPASIYLEFKSAGTIELEEYDLGNVNININMKKINVKKGILRIYCEKSSTLFYYEKNKFKTIAVSD